MRISVQVGSNPRKRKPDGGLHQSRVDEILAVYPNLTRNELRNQVKETAAALVSFQYCNYLYSASPLHLKSRQLKDLESRGEHYASWIVNSRIKPTFASVLTLVTELSHQT